MVLIHSPGGSHSRRYDPGNSPGFVKWLFVVSFFFFFLLLPSQEELPNYGRLSEEALAT